MAVARNEAMACKKKLYDKFSCESLISSSATVSSISLINCITAYHITFFRRCLASRWKKIFFFQLKKPETGNWKPATKSVQWFLSVDPIFKNYPWYTPYQFAGNSPIAFIDLDGLEQTFNYSSMVNAIKNFKAADVRNETHKSIAALGQTTEKPKNPQTWNDWDVWKNVSKERLFEVKENYVKDYKEVIHSASEKYDIPPVLLAGVAFTEFGGDPPIIDDVAYAAKSLGLFGGNERKTSFGDLSMQVRTAMETVGYGSDYSKTPAGVENQVIESLKDPVQSFFIVARHLSDLIDVDFKGKKRSELTEDDMKVVLGRYNQGSGKSLENIKKDLSYGNSVFKRREKLEQLIKKPEKKP